MEKLSSIEVNVLGAASSTFACSSEYVTLVLVLATGSKWSGPVDLPEGEADLRQFVSGWREKFRDAQDIVIVGGGAVGAELSGEIRDEYPVRHLGAAPPPWNSRPYLGQENHDCTRTG